MCFHKIFVILFIVTIQLVLFSFAYRNDVFQISETNEYRTDLLTGITDTSKPITFKIDIDEGEIG